MTEQPVGSLGERRAGLALGWVDDIERLTLANVNLRTVVRTGPATPSSR